MFRTDFAVRPARDRHRIAVGSVVLAVLSILIIRGSTGWMIGLVLLLVAVACRWPRCATHGDTFVMRGLVRTRRFPKSAIQSFVVRDGLAGRQYVEVVTHQGQHLRVPGTDRPAPRYRDGDAGDRTPAEAVCNRLHLWHMVSAF